MIAYDTIYPKNQATGTVSIKVSRNPHAPVFTSQNYEVTIDEKIPLGGSVVKLLATDVDKDTVEYKLKASGEAAAFFYLNPETGIVTTKRFLTDIRTKEFRVSPPAADAAT